MGEFLVKEITGFGVRWVAIGILSLIAVVAFHGFFGQRYRELKVDVEALKKDSGTTVIHNNVTVSSGPLDRGNVDEIRALTQAEYDALPVKNEKTLYVIVNRESD